MPFIRYVRDKRGTETTYVMHAYRSPQGTSATRVLYLFRSSAHVRMGRRPLDEEAREALEHTHPDLSFDWTTLTRDGELVRNEERPREARRQGRGRQGQGGPAPEPEIEDLSVLGRTVGAARATRLRARYRELIERIGRRARTPEQRDRLIEAAERLNPDDWPDAESVRAGVATIEEEWDALAAELPARRRSRRGRRRESGEAGPPAPADTETSDEVDAAAPDGSAIMAPNGEVDDTKDVAGLPASDGDSDRDDAGSVGAGPDGRRSGHDVPGDDELRQD